MTSAVAAGSYPFVVTAQDQRGRHAFTANGTLTVGSGGTSQAQLPIILSISLVAPQTPSIVVSGSANHPYVILATADLLSPAWTAIARTVPTPRGCSLARIPMRLISRPDFIVLPCLTKHSNLCSDWAAMNGRCLL
jgi:hypothetical protein